MSTLFRNLTMSWKFTIFGVLATLLLVIAIVQSYSGMRATEDRVDLFVEKYQAVAFIVSEMHTQGIQAEQAIRNVILNPSDEKAMANYKKANEEFLESHKNASALAKSIGKYEQSLAKLTPLWQENSIVKDEIINLARSGNQPASIEMLAKQETPKWREIKAQIVDIQKTMKKDMVTLRKEMDHKNENNLKVTVAILGAAVVMINIFLLVFWRLLQTSLDSMVHRLKDIASGEGDLTQRLEVQGKDELAQAAHWLNAFIEKLNRTLVSVSSTTVTLASATYELNSTADQMATSAEEVAAQAMTVATASEEMAATSNDIASNCHAAAESAQHAANTTEKGFQVVKHTVDGIRLRGERTFRCLLRRSGEAWHPPAWGADARRCKVAFISW